MGIAIGLKVGDRVNWTNTERPLRNGLTQDDFMNEYRVKNYDISLFDKLLDKYYKPRTKTTRGTNTIKSSKLVCGIRTYTLKNGKTFTEEWLERIPHHKGFADLLSKCYRTDSTITRTGEFYRLGDVVVMEYMKSTKNVWVDKLVGDMLSKEEELLVEQEIRSFFYNDVKSVSFGLEINQFIEDRANKIQEIIEKHRVEFG